jgi:NAD(P)-dependent dehydrogenase (short-subunit alcohol dehydrogenase family)
MQGSQVKTAVITGASSGIGLAAAEALLRRGWRVIGVGRDPVRTAAAQDMLRSRMPDGDITMLQGDLSLMAEADRLATAIGGLTDHVNLLANNAGGMADAQRMTAEGLEENFAANHLGPFRLTQRLQPLLLAAVKDGGARVVMTSSDGSEMIPGIDCDDLQSLSGWSPGRAYCTGKLANVLFARALAQRWGADGIIAHAFHPGTVDSNFFAHVPAETRRHTDAMAKITPEQGAETLIWLATSPEAGECNGGYWSDCQPRKPNPVVEQDGLPDRFWEASEKLLAKASG